MKENGGFDEFKRKNAAYAKNKRVELKVGVEQLPKKDREDIKRKNRQYSQRKQREYRERKKKTESTANGSTVSSDPKTEEDGQYKTASALNKAVAKLKRAAPATLVKSKQAVAKFLKTFDPSDVKEMVGISENKRKGSRAIKPSIVSEVDAFYQRDDISRISPNVKHCKRFEDPSTGAKEFKQIRFLLYTLSDVYRMFLEQAVQNSDEKPPIRFSKFCALRPDHVKLVNDTPLDQCRCFYHSNFILCCEAINRFMPKFPKYGNDLERLILCNNPKKECYLRKCKTCPNIEDILATAMKNSDKQKGDSVTFNKWVKNPDTNRFQKVVQEETLENLMQYFRRILPDFQKHSYVKRQQAASFEADKIEAEQSNNEVAVLQIDFAENFVCEAQDEVQSAHWNQAAVSLFTSCLMLSGKQKPVVIASDNLKHTKNEIACYLFDIVSKVPSTVKVLKVWSDGPNNQFKNKFIGALLKLLEVHFKIKIIWNFFATSHGKGCVDGIGAVVKNRVKRIVKSRKAIVNCAQDFVDSFNSEPSTIELIHFSTDDFEKSFKKFQIDATFQDAAPVANIFNSHQFQVVGSKVIGFFVSSEGYAYCQNS
ncbi:uncharacterized protein LOC119085183 isoform X2 [Bradysia coprophila]|nr:uncharacterized protein LOC119084239 isoform X2 [Bradysia coprophila]XP_037051391.1 uncharacterized protein LOC119085183 isoform X2 [Bradysia coprophila]